MLHNRHPRRPHRAPSRTSYVGPLPDEVRRHNIAVEAEAKAAKAARCRKHVKEQLDFKRQLRAEAAKQQQEKARKAAEAAKAAAAAKAEAAAKAARAGARKRVKKVDTFSKETEHA